MFCGSFNIQYFLQIFKAQNFSMEFFFFLGGGGKCLLEALGILVGFDIFPHSITPVTWIPEYFPPGITTLAISLQNDSEEQKKTGQFISF